MKSQSKVALQIRQQNSLLELGLAIPLFLVYVGIDILAAPIWAVDMALYPVYFLIWQTVLATFAVMLYAVGRSLLVPLWLILSGWNGAEDALWYWLQQKPIPDLLPWLTSPLTYPQPATPLTLYIGVAESVVLLALIIVLKR